MSEVGKILHSLYASYQSGDYFKAELGIRDVLTKSPNNVEVLQLGALTALAINQIITAHQRLDQAKAGGPMTAELANIEGRVLKASGDWAAAEEAYNRAENLDPKFDRAKINRLNLLSGSDQPKRVLEELASGYDFGDRGKMAKSQALTDLGRYEEALSLLEDFNSKTYADKILFQRLKCFSVLGRLDDMQDTFLAFSETSALYAQALNVVVNSFEMRGDRKQSLAIIDRVSDSAPLSAKLQVINLRTKLDQTDNANLELDRLSKKHPEDIEVLCAVADAARLSGNADESCEIYKRALTLGPGNFETMYGFAQSAITAGRFAEAQTLLQGALAQSPNNQFLLALVATLLRQMGGDHTRLYDYSNFVRVYDLNAPEGYADVTAFNAALKGKLDELHVYQHAPVNQSLRIGSQTEMDLTLIDDPVLRAFFDAIDAPIHDYMERLGGDASHSLRRRNRGAYRISGAWSVRLSENGHHVNHVHPMGWLSSAYYVDLPPTVNAQSQEGWIKFGQPALDLGQEPEHVVQPKVGRLVLFPSYMWHGTIPFSGSATRLTLPFDVVPA